MGINTIIYHFYYTTVTAMGSAKLKLKRVITFKI